MRLAGGSGVRLFERNPIWAAYLVGGLIIVGLWRIWAFRLSIPAYIHLLAAVSACGGYYLSTRDGFAWPGTWARLLTVSLAAIAVYGWYGAYTKRTVAASDK